MKYNPERGNIFGYHGLNTAKVPGIVPEGYIPFPLPPKAPPTVHTIIFNQQAETKVPKRQRKELALVG